MPLKTRFLRGGTGGVNIRPPFNIGRPLYFYHLPQTGAAGNIVVNQRLREGPQNAGNPAIIQSINTGTPGYYAPAALTSSNFQNSDEVRFDGSPSSNFFGGYPISLIALFRPRDITNDHYLIALIDPATDTHRMSLVLSNGLGDIFRAFHDTFGGAGDVGANTTGTYSADKWYFCAAVFTKSGSTITATIRTLSDDGIYEEVGASSTNPADGTNLYTRMCVGAVSRSTPLTTGNVDIAIAAATFTEVTENDLRWLAANPAFFLTKEQSPSTFSITQTFPNVSPRASQFDKVLHYLPPDWHDQREFNRLTSEAVDNLFEGKIRSTGNFTLTPSTTTTQVEDRRTGPGSVIFLMPQTANAASAATAIWFSNLGEYNANGNPSFVVNHDSDAATDRTFRYFIVG